MLFDLWLNQNQHPPKIWSDSHLQLLDNFTSGPIPITETGDRQEARIQQLQQFDYDGPQAHYDIGSQASMTHSQHHLHCKITDHITMIYMKTQVSSSHPRGSWPSTIIIKDN
jgi:hypothetical protein